MMTKYVVFRVQNQEYCLSIAHVQSIEPMQSVTRVPTDINYVRGVTNLRGTVIPVIDLGLRLGIDAVQTTLETRIIVLSTKDDAAVGMIVDAAQTVIDLEDDMLQPALDSDEVAFTKYLVKVEDRVLYILDSERVMSIDA